MNKFRNGNINILIATDVADNGLDIDNIDFIIDYDIWQNIDDYIHRIGRQASKKLIAFTLISKVEFQDFTISKKQKM